ncbi:metal-dependent hydrolase family protein [Gaoshiqia sp. Z1-71]|uniref:metal-dependent hydrolase family protein n=1 Tax=Gaoshiqia hydrogeniformans TaxID=3290090 RepID=UPI003BF8ECBB
MKRIYILLFAISNLLFSIKFANAQVIDVKIIKAGKLLDVENGKVLLNQIILIEKDTIKAIGSNVAIPPNAMVYDLSNYTVLPGLIDCHTHLTWQTGDYYDDLFRKSLVDFAVLAPLYAKKTLEAGFTSCRDLGSFGFIDVALRNAINKGDLPGPRLQVAGVGISCTGGHGDLVGFSPWLDSKLPIEMTGIADGVDAIKKEVRYLIKNGAGVIKFYASGGILEEGSFSGPRYSQEEMNAIVAEAKMWGTKTCAHTMGSEATKKAILAGVSSVEHGCLIDDECIQMMKDKGTYFIQDSYVDEYILSEYVKKGYPMTIINKEKLVAIEQQQIFQKALAAGVKIAFGTDAGVYPHGMNVKQFSIMVRWGMTPMQAIQSSTIVASNVLGWQNMIGSIKIGKLADIIATKENPLDNIATIENVMFVMKGGIVFKNNTITIE